MAMLATLEGTETKKGGILSKCMGYCETVGATVRGCLGGVLGVFKGFESSKFADSYNQILEYCYYTVSTVQEYMHLGPWDTPIVNFILRFKELKTNSPQYTDEEAAAITYFAMIAQQPEPTDQSNIYAVDYVKLDSIIYGDLSFNDTLKEGGPNYLNVLWDFELTKGIYTKYNGKRFGVEWKNKNPQYVAFGTDVTAYTGRAAAWNDAVLHLNRFLQYNGLYTGIEKTISEEKRKLQGLRAQALASQAAAAKALAISRMNENTSAETIEKYEQQRKKALADEQEIVNELKKLQNTPTGTGDLTGTGSSILPILGIAAAAALAFMG